MLFSEGREDLERRVVPLPPNASPDILYLPMNKWKVQDFSILFYDHLGYLQQQNVLTWTTCVRGVAWDIEYSFSGKMHIQIFKRPETREYAIEFCRTDLMELSANQEIYNYIAVYLLNRISEYMRNN
jgi:hypothetical protein